MSFINLQKKGKMVLFDENGREANSFSFTDVYRQGE